ncbi:MAG: 23S rRNA (adenine(2503)-C(2))-methyltransferase RlmN [Armatimonadota bacterium]
MTTTELSELCVELGYPSYRGKQLADWLYKKSAASYEDCKNLPKDLIAKLNEKLPLDKSKIADKKISKDGTTKYLLQLSDNQTIECVLLPYQDRTSICISTQIGCAVGCKFCATGDCGFTRNLTTSEMVDQILTLQADCSSRISNVVIMGMGEPMLNYDNTLKAINIITNEIGISARKITLSTVGITSGILKLAKENLQITLAVSLHASDDVLRNKLIPLAKNNPLESIIDACKVYADKTGRRITYEYMLLEGINDSEENAGKLAKLVKGTMCHINLIPYNAVTGKEYRKPHKTAVQAFRKVLEDSGIEVSQRFEKGEKISAACGQLKKQSL